jgi:hypothetical protein
LWAGLQVSCGKIVVIYLIVLIIVLSFILYAMCTNVAVGQIIQPARQLVGETCTIWTALFLGKKTPVPIEWEAEWAPKLVWVFLR